MSDILLVIDMQNVYLKGQPWGCEMIEKAQNNIIALLESGKFDNVIFTKYIPAKEPVGRWKEYNREYTDINANLWMSEIIEPLIPYTKKYPVYEKSVYSSYIVDEVRKKAAKADRVVVTGVVAECCVISTVISAIDAGDMVVYISDGVAGLDEKMQCIAEKIVRNFAPLHCEVKTTEAYLKEMA